MTAFMLVVSLLFSGADIVVENEIVPKKKPLSMVFEQDLVIGPTGDDDEYLNWVGSAVNMVISPESIYVLDPEEHRVVQFDHTGKMVRAFGSRGEGPGEFQECTNISLLDSGNIVVSEFRNGINVFNFFDKDGKFINRETYGDGIRMVSANFSPDEQLIGASFMTFAEYTYDMTFRYGVLDRGRNPRLVLSTVELPSFDPEQMANPKWWLDFLPPWFRLFPSQGLVTFGPDGSLFAALTDKYEITRYDADMSEKMTIRKKYKPALLNEKQMRAMVEPIRMEVLSVIPAQYQNLVSEELIAQAVEKANFSGKRPPIMGLVPREDGGLLVITNYDTKSQIATADIFESDGSFVGTTKLPPLELNLFGGYFGFSAKMKFYGGKAYTMVRQDEDLYLHRYNYRYK